MTFSHRSLKRDARRNLKEHYLLFVVVCLIAVLISAEFVTTDNIAGISAENFTANYTGVNLRIESASQSFIGTAFNWIDGKIHEDERGNEIFGRSNGTLNAIFDYFGNDTFLTHTYNAVNHILGSNHIAGSIVASLGSFIAIGFWFFVQNTYIAVSRRIILEGRVYKKVPFSRYLFFLRVKCLLRASLTMAVYTVLRVLSAVFLIPFPFVFYGLYLVPYIVAENPDIKFYDAIKLSWNMMRGNKMKMFLLDLSLIGWYLLGLITLGATNIFYANPYRLTIYSEFYATVRAKAIENKIKGYEYLNDRYLFARCSTNELMEAYSDVYEELKRPEYKLEGLTGRYRFIADHFGVVLWNTKDEMEYEAKESHRVMLLARRDEAEGRSYPSKLYTITGKLKRPTLESIHYMRNYSLLSLVVMFFTFSGFGWVWELIYYYIQQGRIINRGVLHGPWLPIYGVGGLCVLIFLHAFRKKPVLHFWATVVLCGLVEYFVGWGLEKIYNEKWWDYSGYFFNLHGRVCAEGLFVFGVAGMAFIYVLAPLLDDQVRKWNKKILTPIAIVFIVIFAMDIVYSRFKPNTGSGVTGDFDKGTTEQTVSLEQ